MIEPLTPETFAELRRLMDAYGPTTGYQPVRDRWFALARGAVNALPALLDAAARLARVEGLIDDWESYGGPGTDCERVFGEQKVSVEFVVSKVREALK